MARPILNTLKELIIVPPCRSINYGGGRLISSGGRVINSGLPPMPGTAYELRPSTGAKFSDGRMETIRTDGRKIFRTDGKFSVGRKNLGRTEKKVEKTEKFTLPLLGEFFRTSRDSSVSGQDPHKSRDVRKNSPKSGKTNFRKNNYSSGVAIVS